MGGIASGLDVIRDDSDSTQVDKKSLDDLRQEVETVLDGKTIHETGLRESDINVLTLYRGTTVIPNPRNDRVLQGDDRLLCFGKLDAMRDLLPPKAQRRRRPKVQELSTDEAG